MINTMFTKKTGEVFIRNYDQGIIETMGGYIEVPTSKLMIEMIGGVKRNYFIDIPEIEYGEQSKKVPVIFGNPQAIRSRKIYPSFLIVRQDPVPAMNRWHSIGMAEYRVPVNTSNPEWAYGVSGYSEMEQKVQDMPFDIVYNINVMALLESQAMAMLRKVMTVYKPYSKINVIDSLGATRTYTAYNESVNDISELNDVADRMEGYSISVRVECELTLSVPLVSKTMKTEVITGHIINES